ITSTTTYLRFAGLVHVVVGVVEAVNAAMLELAIVEVALPVSVTLPEKLVVAKELEPEKELVPENVLFPPGDTA
ncbi:MAG: hypothetical protein AAB964_00890, partial [Patescibacteria group bacterium]